MEDVCAARHCGVSPAPSAWIDPGFATSEGQACRDGSAASTGRGQPGGGFSWGPGPQKGTGPVGTGRGRGRLRKRPDVGPAPPSGTKPTRTGDPSTRHPLPLPGGNTIEQAALNFRQRQVPMPSRANCNLPRTRAFRLHHFISRFDLDVLASAGDSGHCLRCQVGQVHARPVTVWGGGAGGARCGCRRAKQKVAAKAQKEGPGSQRTRGGGSTG